ncbi:DUF899-domain-containing protein [Pyrenochaeta sp. DS3sAY3a]|nr:DUF899-domain-containing protein [Pyrenochaeta sp. DS3sAY3a]
MSTPIPDPAYLKWPANTSPSYITARRALLEKEYALLQQVEAVAAERRALDSGPVLPPYTFTEGCQDLNSTLPPKETSLLDILAQNEHAHTTLVVYHMMMGEEDKVACSSCSMFLDGLNGVAKHLAQRVVLLVVAKAPIAAIRAYARKHGWNDLRFLSSLDNTFNKDMGVEKPPWIQGGTVAQSPGLSVFRLEDGGAEGEKQLRFWYQTVPHFGQREGSEVIRGMDLLSPVWQLLDVTPEGRGEWDPSLGYVEKWDGVEFDD